MGMDAVTGSANVTTDTDHAQAPEAAPPQADTAAGLATEASADIAAAAHAASTEAQVVFGKVTALLGDMVDGGKATAAGVSHAEQAAAGRSTEPFDAAELKRMNAHDPKGLAKALDNAMKNNPALAKYNSLSSKMSVEGVMSMIGMSPNEVSTITTCKNDLAAGHSLIDDNQGTGTMDQLLAVLKTNHVTKGDLAD